MFITSWTIDIRINIQIWLLYRRYKSEWYNFWWATIQDIAACACKVWTLFAQACGQEECSQTTTTTTMTTTTTTTDKSGLHRLVTNILSWAKNPSKCKLCLSTFITSNRGLTEIATHNNSTTLAACNTCTAFWLTTECRSRAYAILICLSSSLSLSSVSTPPDHMLGQIRFILCMHMQLYPV